MRERCESLGGHLRIWSEGNAGTEVELRIPAHVAYAQPGASLSSRLRDLFLAAVVQYQPWSGPARRKAGISNFGAINEFRTFTRVQVESTGYDDHWPIHNLSL